MTAHIPNEVLDVNTLEFVRDRVKTAPGLIAGYWAKERYFLGAFPIGVDRCAIGQALDLAPGHTAFQSLKHKYEEVGLDVYTVSFIISANDNAADAWAQVAHGRDATKRERRDYVLSFCEQAIKFANAVSDELHKPAGTSKTPAQIQEELAAA